MTSRADSRESWRTWWKVKGWKAEPACKEVLGHPWLQQPTWEHWGQKSPGMWHLRVLQQELPERRTMRLDVWRMAKREGGRGQQRWRDLPWGRIAFPVKKKWWVTNRVDTGVWKTGSIFWNSKWVRSSMNRMKIARGVCVEGGWKSCYPYRKRKPAVKRHPVLCWGSAQSKVRGHHGVACVDLVAWFIFSPKYWKVQKQTLRRLRCPGNPPLEGNVSLTWHHGCGEQCDASVWVNYTPSLMSKQQLPPCLPVGTAAPGCATICKYLQPTSEAWHCGVGVQSLLFGTCTQRCFIPNTGFRFIWATQDWAKPNHCVFQQTE